MGDATRHIGLDLGGTNIKWAVVERAGDDWRTLDQGQVADRRLGRRAARSCRSWRRWPCEVRDGAGGPRGAASASPCPASTSPRPGVVTFLTNVPGRLVGDAGRRAASPTASGPAHGAHQRCPGLRPGRAALRGRPRRALVHRASRWAPASAASSPSTTRSSRAIAARPASWATRPSTPTGPGAAAATAAAWRPTRGPTRWRWSAARPTRGRPSRRRGRATSGRVPAWPRSAATWASASPTPSPC